MELKLIDKSFFFDLIKDARKKRFPTDYALINLATFSMMFPDLKKLIKDKKATIIIDGVKIQLSKCSPQDKIYLDFKPFDLDKIELNFIYNNLKK